MRKVREVRFHQVPHIKDMGQLEPCVTTSGLKYPGIEMSTDFAVVFFKYKGIEFIVPLANCVSCTLEPEALKVVPKTK